MADDQRDGGELFDEIAGASSAALVGLVLAPTLGTDAAVAIGTMSAPFAAQLACGIRELAARRAERVRMAGEEAVRESGRELAELVQRSLSDDRSAAIMWSALQAAANAADERTVRALGRAYARGVLTSDEAVADAELRVISTLAGLEPVDVRVLGVMATEPRWRVRSAEQSSESLLIEAVPQAAAVIDSVVARLTTLGLISSGRPGTGIDWAGVAGAIAVTEYGQMCLARLDEIGRGGVLTGE